MGPVSPGLQLPDPILNATIDPMTQSQAELPWCGGGAPAVKQGVVLKPARAVVALWGLNWLKEPRSRTYTVTLTPDASASCSHLLARLLQGLPLLDNKQ